MDSPINTFWSETPTNIGLTIPDVWFKSNAWNMKFSYVHCSIRSETSPVAPMVFNSKQVTE